MEHIVLLGDSIFDNKVYVDEAPDVVGHLRNILPRDWKATLCAVARKPFGFRTRITRLTRIAL